MALRDRQRSLSLSVVHARRCIDINPWFDEFFFSAISFAETPPHTVGFGEIEVSMEKDDAIIIMSKLAAKLDDVLEMEDLVSAFAEFLVHIRPTVSEQDFAFLATVGAMIYRKGSRRYDSSLETDLLMARLRAISAT